MADTVAYRCTGPTTGAVRVLDHDGDACLGFVANGKTVHFPRLTSGTLMVSKDGKTIVMIEDYLSANVENGSVVALIDGEKIINPRVLTIWHDGQRRGMYDVHRLVKEPAKVRESISHVRWVAQMPASIDARFSLITTTGREITFDSKTGNIIGERDVPVPKRG